MTLPRPARLALLVLSLASTAHAQERLSFRSAVQRAVDRSNLTLASLDEISRAEALQRQARASSWPSLIGNITYTRLDDDRVLGGRVVSAANQINANLALTVPLFAPRAWAQATRASDAVEVSRASAGEIRRQVAVSAGRAYLTIIGQQRAVETSERARDTARAHLAFARARTQGGVGSGLDEVRAAQEVAIAETQLQSSRLGLARAREALAVVLGSDTPVEINGEAQLEALTAAPSERPGEHPPAPRADQVLADLRVRAAQRAVDQQWTEYSPLLSATFQPFYQNPPTLTLPTLGWQAQVILTIPILDVGLRSGLKAERQAALAIAQQSRQGTTRQIRSEERLTREAVQHAEEALTASQESLRLAQTSLELATVAYKEGATTNLELVDAERRARDAATASAVAEDALRQARLDLLVAQGKFP